METFCPFCKQPLHIELTAQFVEQVDPNIMNMVNAQINRQLEAASHQKGLFGGMMKMSANMAKNMQGVQYQNLQMYLENPPLVKILRCLSCGAALSADLG